jgi:hypothetical protein
LRIESDGFQGTIRVGKTDFWDRAEKTRDAAIDKQKSERLLAKERAIREAEERMKAERIKRYETATVFEVDRIPTRGRNRAPTRPDRNHANPGDEQVGSITCSAKSS